MIQEGRLGLYIHWPFCLAKCPYCDFNSHVSESIDQDVWRESYLKALDHYAALLPRRRLNSVFFGGGTPSLMPPETVAAILDRVQKNFAIANDIEITLEANPTSVEVGKFRAFREGGVNRVSLGVQALNDEDLKFLGRKHNVSEAMKAIDIARENFDRFSFDLIYARPNQKLSDWQEELEKAVTLSSGHLSLYQLTIERGTPFFLDYSKGVFSIPGEDLAADFYHLTQDVLEANGMPAYEVSNHAKADQESRHNLIYWHYDDYIGIGPGAHGRLTLDGQKFATRDHRAPEIWLQKMREGTTGAHPFEGVAPVDRFSEALMMGLRLKEGVPVEKLEREAGHPLGDMIQMSNLERLRAEKLMEADEDRLRLTREGLLRLNAVVPYLLKAA